MMIRKLVATAVMAIVSTGIASATANGQVELADLSMSGVDGPVAYTTTLASDHRSATVDLASGKFELMPDAVKVIADDGAVVGSIPTSLHMQTGETFALTPSLDSTGTSLTLTPASAPAPADATSADSIALKNVLGLTGGLGLVAGAGIGCAIGVAIGIWFFVVGAVVGCVAGAIIGGGIGFVFW